MSEQFNHKQIDKKWQEIWEKDKIYQTSGKPKNKQYILDMFPYPSGAGLHVGHPEGYTATDIYSRFLRMSGHSVLHPMGWDSFGLPAENYAIKMGIPPWESIAKNIKRFKEQINSIGLSYDWDREIDTSDPEYYKWTQWLFLQLYKKGLAYKKEAYVNWCPKDQTVLANEQVISGACERCGTQVEQKLLSQWFFKITDYADRLLKDMEKLDWPEPIKLVQKNWIGRSEGAEIEFPISFEKGKVNFLLIHGLKDHLSDIFFPWLKSELEKQGFTVQAPVLPNPDKPKAAEQVKYIFDSCKMDENTVIFGHSLGAVVAMDFLMKYNKPIKGLVLAAAGINPKFPGVAPRPHWKDFNYDINGELIKKLAGFRTVISDLRESESAKYEKLRVKYLRQLAKEIDASLVEVGSAEEHFVNKKEPAILENILPKIKVFTTRPDTLFGATYMVLAPEHPLVNQITTDEQKNYVINYVIQSKKKTELQRTALEKEKSGVLTGAFAINPATKEKIPVWIADYVLMNYGTGAIMAVPAHDERDFEFAKKYDLEVKPVVAPFMGPDKPDKSGNYKEAFIDYGKVINSGKYDGLPTEKAIKKMGEDFGKLKTQYKLRDWLVSRQRYWGAPIPIIYCDNPARPDDSGHSGGCGMQPVPEKDLPVELPRDIDFLPGGESPLSRSKSFHNVKCPKCGGPARRDSDTMDTFVDSSWYFLRFADAHNSEEFADKKEIAKWAPVDTYVGGAEHAVLHLMYARFLTKALSDLGFLKFEEPFLKLRNQGLILGPDGEKMSKSRGNVVNPDEVIEQFGADAFRMYEMFMGPLEDAKPWSTQGIVGVRRFLDKVWRLSSNFSSPLTGEDVRSNDRTDEGGSNIHRLIKKVGEDIQAFKFNTSIAAFMEFLNENKEMSQKNWETFLMLLAPFAPHLTEELWQNLGHKNSIHLESWPKFDERLVKATTVTIAVQVLGRLRAALEFPAGTLQEDVKAKAMTDSNVQKFLDGKEIVKVVFVADKLINFVVR